MKRIILLAALLIATASASAQSYTRNGKTFIASAKSTSKRSDRQPTLTAYKWQDSKGKEYPIYQSPSGSCFVLRISAKTGKEYRQYLDKEICREIARETGVDYQPKTARK